MSKNIDLQEYFDKEFYIIDRKDYIFFPRKIKIIGIVSKDKDIKFFVNVKDDDGKYMIGNIEDLETFKTFKEAEKEAKRLNGFFDDDIRAEELLYMKNQYEKLKMEFNQEGGLDER